MHVKSYETKVGSVRKYSFPFVLDDDGQEQRTRMADDGDVEDALDQSGPGSPSEAIHQLVLKEQERFRKMGYTEALQRVRDRNPSLMRLYAAEVGGCVRVY